MTDSIRAAIIGGSLDGKSTLAAGFTRGLWRQLGVRSFVFDPFKGETDWGPGAFVIGPTREQLRRAGPGAAEQIMAREFQRFRQGAFNITRGQRVAIVWDEGTDRGRERENTALFTAIRHSTDWFFFIGHAFATMLPVMRGSLSDVFLATRDPDDAADWARQFVDGSIAQAATTLRQYEFLHKRKHCPARVLRYTADDLKKGVLP